MNLKQLRKHAPAGVVLVLGCLATVVAWLAEDRIAKGRVALHAQADAMQYQHILQQGISAYLHLSRDLAGYFAAAGKPSEHGLDIYARTADLLDEHPGLSYIGYVERVARTDLATFEAAVRKDDPAFRIKGMHPGAGDVFPYLYVYPRTPSARSARGLDFAGVPERWRAMQQARDSGLSTVTSRHSYRTDPSGEPIVLVFTPVYDAARPATTLAERQAALRGFVFSIFEIQEAVGRVVGRGFGKLFDLEIYDGPPQVSTVVYDNDKVQQALHADPAMPLVHRGELNVANRRWTLYFFARPVYAERYGNPYGAMILLFGFATSGSLSYLTGGLARRMRKRARQHAEQRRFEDVFERHPSAVYLLDLERRFVNANSKAAQEFKIDKASLIGMSVGSMIVPENREMARARFDEALQGNSVSYDSAFIDGSGARVEVSVIMMPVTAGDRVVNVLGIAQNITERKLAEWRLRESKQMLRLVVNHIPQRVFWKDTSLAYLGCNEAFCRDAGLGKPEDIIGKTDYDLNWRASADAFRKDDMETMSGNRPKINYEERQRHDDGTELWLRTSKIPLAGIDGRTVALLGLYEDITERKAMERKLEEMAHYDSLTGLANRAFFNGQLELAALRARRNRALAGLLYLDLDKFKSINDTYGHDVGDALLKGFAQRIKATLRDADLAARLGGDEFAVLLEDLAERAAGELVARKLVAAMQAPFVLDGAEVAAGTSIGVAFLEPDMATGELVRRADQAMYRAKRGGRNRYEVDGVGGGGESWTI